MLIKISSPIVLPVTRAMLKNYYKANQQPAQLTEKRVLILAPHVDDETIGAGGTIQLHKQNGAKIHCVFLTDGAKSQSNLTLEQLMEQRKEEAKKVQQLLDIDELSFYDLPDGQVDSNPHSQQLLENTIETFKPDVIYCPTFIDCHNDHVATGRIVADVLAEMPNEQPKIRLYEINCLIPPKYINCVVDISSTFEKKLAAIEIFRSQAIDFDGFIELSKLKTGLLTEKVKAVETFYELPKLDFIRIYQQLDTEAHNYSSYFKQVNKAETLLWGTFKNEQLKRSLYEKGRG